MERVSVLYSLGTPLLIVLWSRNAVDLISLASGWNELNELMSQKSNGIFKWAVCNFLCHKKLGMHVWWYVILQGNIKQARQESVLLPP